ncbi:MMPL family transporter [Glutamicibacter protophormiae]|uniref:MMPL family transporter n=1 Tax=Glutamicibacter protophormiae TaxID=37930 RepID=UPI003A8E2AF5
MKVPVISRVASSLTSRRSARWWTVALLAVVVLLFGALSGVDAPKRADSSLVAGSDSAKVAELVAQNSDSTTTSAILVANGSNGAALSGDQIDQVKKLAPQMASELPVKAGPALPSEDAQAVMVPISWDTVDLDADKQTLTDIRDWLGTHELSGVQLQMTGSTAFAADVSQAFAGADFTLLAVTVGIVAVLLIATYRSPILWLIPLAVVALADRSASMVANVLGNAWDLHFDSGVLSVLVFGAGTNYALLLISRYRDELQKNEDHRKALAKAWAASFEAILTSNLTVVLALLTLSLAVMEDTRGLGIVCAAGLLIAALFVFLLPPILALCGRKVFWPLVPKPGQPSTRGKYFGKAATAVMRKPGTNLAALAVLLLVLAGALTGTRLGLDQTQQFRTPTESASAMNVLSEHYPAGEAQPITVLVDGSDTGALQEQIKGLDGVLRVGEAHELANSSWQQFSVISSDDPSSSAAMDLVAQIRSTAGETSSATVLVGGQTAAQYDSHQGHLRDLYVIAPMIMIICFAMLGWLTRSWKTALSLGLVNLLSAAAAVGLGSLISSMVFDVSALDVQVPLLAFVFLVALGVDYTIFFTQRVRQNSAASPLREAVANAARSTGSVITSAGLVLAGVFAALSALPLMVLGQLGLIVGLGVLLDTFVVRTLLLPALFAVLGSNNKPVFGKGSGIQHADESETSPSTESTINA